MSVQVLLCCLSASNDAVKHVVHTPWWPPGSEATAESVGIVARGRVFMTGMMAKNATRKATMAEEIMDVSDIARAAGTSLSGLVSCMANTGSNQSDDVRQLMEAALKDDGVPALTVVEMMGEYGGLFAFSLSCQVACRTR